MQNIYCLIIGTTFPFILWLCQMERAACKVKACKQRDGYDTQTLNCFSQEWYVTSNQEFIGQNQWHIEA